MEAVRAESWEGFLPLPWLHILTLAVLTTLRVFAAGKRAQPHRSCPPPGASCLQQLPLHGFTHIPRPSSHLRTQSQAQQHPGLAQLH